MKKTANASKLTLFIFAAAGFLAGCGGSQPAMTPSAGMSAMQRLGAPSANENAVAMPAARHERIGYVGNAYNDAIVEFRFPKGQPLSGTINFSSPPGGMCSRTDRGTFWVSVSGPAAVEEFKVGGTSPIKTLGTGGSSACAIDKGSGDLAVDTFSSVEIFKHASGHGKKVEGGPAEFYFLGYDGSGDLFADGFTASGTVELAELPAGGSTFMPISLPNSIEFPGSVQWDGTYITVADQEAEAIYRYSISGSAATLQGTVSFSGASDCGDVSIYRGAWFICADAGDNNAKVYAYPAGGAPRYTWTSKSIDLPLSAIVLEK